MKLHEIENVEDFKFKVKTTISTLRAKEPKFFSLYPELLVGNHLFVIGGFLRNIANGLDVFRDLDLISTLKREDLFKLLIKFDPALKINRLGGMKISFQNFDVDIWSIYNNWAFQDDRIKFDFDSEFGDKKVIEKIAEGAFFNYDSLVMNLKTNRYSVRHYNDLVKNKELDILRKNENYVFSNPTREANIIRAYFLQKEFNLSLSNNLKLYLVKELNIIGALKYSKGLDLVLIKSLEYEKKYKGKIDRDDFVSFLTSLIKTHGPLFNQED